MITVKRIKKHTDAVRQSILMIENIEIMLKYKSLPVEEIFRSLSVSSNFGLLSFINEINRRLGMRIEYESAYNDVFKDISIPLDGEDRSYIKGFFSMLGKSDIDGQLANCSLYKELLKAKLISLERDEENRCKAMAVLIIGAGAAVSIIII